jgi:alpha-tubulin suppressor-like RCC1 family protein
VDLPAARIGCTREVWKEAMNHVIAHTASPAHRPNRVLPLGVVLGALSVAWAPPARAQPLAAGEAHTCALDAARSVQCWGENESGQLGNGTIASSASPVAVTGLSGPALAVAAGKGHSCAITNAGAVQCWGDNEFGQLGNGKTDTRSRRPVAVAGLTEAAIAITTGAFHSCALTRGGAVLCWGENVSGELGNGTTMNSSTPVAVSGLSAAAVAVAAGRGHTCALTRAGAVQCWGDNQFGQLGNGTTHGSPAPVAVTGLSGEAIAIAAGAFHTCALLRGGTLQCWGENHSGELGDGTTTNAAAPVAPSGLSPGVIAVAGGHSDTCALASSGTLQCWGDNEFGQLGNGKTGTRSRQPVTVAQLSGPVVAIAVGAFHSCALSLAGTVQCWGENTSGALGNGSTTNSGSPVTVTNFSAYTGSP